MCGPLVGWQAVCCRSSMLPGGLTPSDVLHVRFMFALDRLSARHKPALSDLRLQVASSLARCSSLLKAVALKVMTRAAPNDPDTLWSEVMPQLPALLGCPPASVQNSALQLCKQLMQTANLTAQQACLRLAWQCHTCLYCCRMA